MPRYKDATFPSEAYPFDNRVKQSITLSTGYDARNGIPERVSLNIDGNVVVLSTKNASRLAEAIKRRLTPTQGEVSRYVRTDPKMFAFPPGIFRDSNYASD